eukprot:scaffold156_cov25-Tisochrysis_lutea.AAC.3
MCGWGKGGRRLHRPLSAQDLVPQIAQRVRGPCALDKTTRTISLMVHRWRFKLLPPDREAIRRRAPARRARRVQHPRSEPRGQTFG